MLRLSAVPCTALTLALTLAASMPLRAADADFKSLDPHAISIRLPADIDWKSSPGGAETATLAGDESKPGLYVILVKWKAHHNSRPHFHPNDRFITVLSGTWWVNTGRKYDPDAMKPVPAGSFVTHFKNQVHYDGARDGDVILEIVGMGPGTAVAAETRYPSSSQATLNSAGELGLCAVGVFGRERLPILMVNGIAESRGAVRT